jgi:hypothetical protein
VLADDFDVLDDELADEVEELEEPPALEELEVVDEPEEGLVGWKKVLPVGSTASFLLNSALALQTDSTAETLLSSNGLSGNIVNLIA